MIQVSRAIINNKEDETFLYCIYGNRTQNDILMKEELDHFKTFWNFNIMHALSKTSPESISRDRGEIGYGDKVHYGRIDKALVTREVAGFLPSDGRNRGVVLICGTRSFNKDMINHLDKNYFFKF